MESDWRDLPFSCAVLLNPGVPLKRGTTYPFVDMAALNAGIRSAYATKQREYTGGGSRFMNGDTLMARITPSLENGKIARFCVLNSDSLTLAHGSTEFIVIRGRPNLTDTEFVYYLAQWEEIRNYTIGQMTGTTGRQRVPTDCFDHLIIAIPSPHEQSAIAHVLGTLDDKIGLNRRMNDTLEEMAQVLFKSWFVDFDPVRAKMASRDPGLPKHLADLFPDRLVNSELGEIPEGWEVRPIDKIATFQNGLALQKHRPQGKENRLPVVKIAQLRSGSADSGEWATSEISPDCIINDGDVIFSWSGSLMVKLWCGGRAALNQHLFKVTSKAFPKWFYLNCIYLHLAEFRTIAAGKATTMGHIKRSHLSDALCVVPNHELLVTVDKFFSPLIEKSISSNLQSRTLSDMRDTLLPKLISGEIRLANAEKLTAELT